MVCGKCGHFNDPSWTLCDACSQPLKAAKNSRTRESICADCGYVMSAFDVTCPRCAARRNQRSNEAAQEEMRKRQAEWEAIQAAKDAATQRQNAIPSEVPSAGEPLDHRATPVTTGVNAAKSTLSIDKTLLGWGLCLLFLTSLVGIPLLTHIASEPMTPDNTGGLKGVWQDVNNDHVDSMEFGTDNTGTWNFQWVDKSPDQTSFTYTADGTTLVETATAMDGVSFPTPDILTYTYKIDGDTLTATNADNGVVWTFRKEND